MDLESLSKVESKREESRKQEDDVEIICRPANESETVTENSMRSERVEVEMDIPYFGQGKHSVEHMNILEIILSQDSIPAA